jgi:glycosyltransferase involved in cell wall biosynthesis
MMSVAAARFAYETPSAQRLGLDVSNPLRLGPDLTVLVCTHNRMRLLERSLRSLAEQRVDPSVCWEVLVVDNGSRDGTKDVIARAACAGRLPSLRYIVEPRLGVAHARRRGIRSAQGRLVAFVDDDCLPAPDWIEQVLRFAAVHPEAGAFGGRNEILWETPPAPLAELYGESLGRQELGDQALRMPVNAWRMPVGAGLVVRRDAVRASGWLERGVLRGRHPRSLGAGEDTEIALYLRHAGWEVWYAPACRLRHVIPRHRTTLAYLRRIHRGFGRAEVYLRALARGSDSGQRLEGVAWATRQFQKVLARFPQGFVRFATERPTWLIRLSYAWGCLEGASYYLVTGRGW